MPGEEVNISSYEPDYKKALETAQEQAKNRKLVKVRIKTTRIIGVPQHLTSKNGHRNHGAERLRPVTIGWRKRRTFVFKEKKRGTG